MPVYVIADESGLAKIGRGADPWERLKNMQTATPQKLALLALIEGGAEVEQTLHARFASSRVRGEWFRLTPELEALIRENPAPPRWKGRRPKDHPIERYRYKHRLVLRELADLFQIDTSALAKIIGGKGSPSLALVRRIVEATRGEITADDLVFWPDKPVAVREHQALYVVGALSEAA